MTASVMSAIRKQNEWLLAMSCSANVCIYQISINWGYLGYLDILADFWHSRLLDL